MAESIIATYYLDFGNSSRKFTENVENFFAYATMGSGQKYSYVNQNDYFRLSGKILNIVTEPDNHNRGFVTFSFEPDTFSEKNIPLLLSYLLYSSLQSTIKQLRLIDLELPTWFLNTFAGPKFGQHGIQQLLSVQDRPIFGVILKPRQTLTPELCATLAESAIKGNADYIIDDELLVDQSSCPIIARTSAVVRAITPIAEKQGRRVMYVVNITSEITNCLKWMPVIEAYNNDNVQIAFLVNNMVMGYSTVQEITRQSRIAPIVSSQVGTGMLVLSPYFNISEHILIELSRICGTDAVYAMSHETEYAIDPSKVRTVREHLQKPLGNIKPVMPIYAGSISLGPLLRGELPPTNDFMLQAGSSICGFKHNDYKFPNTVEVATRLIARVINEIYKKGRPADLVAEDLVAEYTKKKSISILHSLGYS